MVLVQNYHCGMLRKIVGPLWTRRGLCHMDTHVWDLIWRLFSQPNCVCHVRPDLTIEFSFCVVHKEFILRHRIIWLTIDNLNLDLSVTMYTWHKCVEVSKGTFYNVSKLFQFTFAKTSLIYRQWKISCGELIAKENVHCIMVAESRNLLCIFQKKMPWSWNCWWNMDLMLWLKLLRYIRHTVIL